MAAECERSAVVLEKAKAQAETEARKLLIEVLKDVHNNLGASLGREKWYGRFYGMLHSFYDFMGFCLPILCAIERRPGRRC